MKKTGLFLLVFLCFIVVTKAVDNAESILIARGYTKYNPREQISSDIYEEIYEEIFNVDFRFERTATRIHKLVLLNDFEYRLYYVHEKKALPNILTTVFIKTDKGVICFYKKNISLTGVKVQTVLEDLTGTLFEKDQLVFY
jgi:hypothetical protein